MTNNPWYRERWPWMLMAGPAVVIVAGTITSVIAFTGADGMVSDDYYKRGLAINRTLGREARATALGIAADVRLERGKVVVRLASRERLPERIQLTFAHPTRAGEDRVVFLARMADGTYEAPVAALSKGRWLLVFETPEWRWTGVAVAPA